MGIPLQITFRGMEASPALTALIREKTEELGRHHERIVGCRATVEWDARHQGKGRLFHVRVDVKIPGKEIVVGRGAGERHEHEDAYLAVREAFDAARRRIETCARQRRDGAKAPAHPQPEARQA